MIQNLIHTVQITKEKGYQFKIIQYKKALKSFQTLNDNVIITYNHVEEHLKTKSNLKNPKKILQKVKIFIETGKLDEIQAITDNQKAIHILTAVHGIGIIKAKKLFEQNKIKTIKQLKNEGTNLLTDQQKISLKYTPNNGVIPKIPRPEILVLEKLLLSKFKKDITFDIAGSFRRGAQESGDIDILFTSKRNNKSSSKMITKFKDVVDYLVKNNILLDSLSSGPTKWMGYGKIDKIPRRIDLMFTSPEKYPFAILYFTGSKEFNKNMRYVAKELGYTLNEHGLTPNPGIKFENEKDIFKFLKLDYVEPINRNT
tara:strand:+ start:6789 stop:7727 length:939 start_codon:yes stop_codon:yes gene_type:complete